MEETVEEEIIQQAPVAPVQKEVIEVKKEEPIAPLVVDEPISLPSVGDYIPSLKFNDNDMAISSDNKEEIISAPKTIERLEEISDARYLQRKLEAEEEEDEDRIKISDQSVSIMDCVDLNAPAATSSSIPDLVLDIEELPF